VVIVVVVVVVVVYFVVVVFVVRTELFKYSFCMYTEYVHTECSE